MTIILLSVLSGAEIDLLVPSFPKLQEIFDLTPFEMTLTLAVNLVAHCLTSLIAGQLSDRYDLKPVLILGLSFFIIGSICCAFASDYWIILSGRLLQGLGISGPAVLAFILIADRYDERRQQELFGILNGAITLTRTFTPLIGSWIALYFNWQGNFIALLILGLICLICSLKFVSLPSKNTSNQATAEPALPFPNYATFFQSTTTV